MTFNIPGPPPRSSRLWRIEDEQVQLPQDPDGPLALLRLASDIAWEHKLRIATSFAAGIVVAGLYAHSLPRIYDATATILLEPGPLSLSGPDAGARRDLDLNRADSELQIIRSERLLSTIFDSLNLQSVPELAPQPPGQLSSIVNFAISVLGSFSGSETVADPGKMDRAAPDAIERGEPAEKRAAFSGFTHRLDARRVGSSYVIEIEYRSSDPALPARVANAAVSGYLLQSVSSKYQMAKVSPEALQGRIDSLAMQVETASKAMQNGTLPNGPTPDADARIIGAALPPLAPSSPRTTLITALGGLLGLVGGLLTIGFGIAFDRKVRSAKTLIAETQVPCLATVPAPSGLKDIPWRSLNRKSFRYANAIRDLRTAIDIACAARRREGNMVIALAGTRPGRGVSELGLSLAQMIQRGGRHVTLFHSGNSALDHRITPKVEDKSTAPLSLADAAARNIQTQKVEFRNLDGLDTMRILSDDRRANLFADFRSPAVVRIIEDARVKGDVVLDLPNLHGSLDALALAYHADVTLVVATAGRSRVDEVKDAVQNMRRAGVMTVATVLNQAKA